MFLANKVVIFQDFVSEFSKKRPCVLSRTRLQVDSIDGIKYG